MAAQFIPAKTLPSGDPVISIPKDPKVHEGFLVIPTLGDGNCLFRSLAVGVTGDEERHGEIRAAVVKEMSDNMDRYIGFFAHSRNPWVAPNNDAPTYRLLYEQLGQTGHYELMVTEQEADEHRRHADADADENNSECITDLIKQIGDLQALVASKDAIIDELMSQLSAKQACSRACCKATTPPDDAMKEIAEIRHKREHKKDLDIRIVDTHSDMAQSTSVTRSAANRPVTRSVTTRSASVPVNPHDTETVIRFVDTHSHMLKSPVAVASTSDSMPTSLNSRNR